MSYLISSAIIEDITFLCETSPEVWRQIRRYNLPVQLALTAAHEVTPCIENPKMAALISLAPCVSGSQEIFRWLHHAVQSKPDGRFGDMRMNPTHTLHAVDNLALSALAIAFQNHAYCLGLGGAAGQAWAGLEVVQERLDMNQEAEVLLMGGDQDDAECESKSLGVALLFTSDPKPYSPMGKMVRLIGVERSRNGHVASVQPHAANGLAEFLRTIPHHTVGHHRYAVPMQHSDGHDNVTVILEVE